MADKVVLLGKDFKELIAAATRFPAGAGSFAGSELVHLSATGGTLVAVMAGLVLAKARTAVEGDLPLCAMDERLAGSFAPLCPDTAKVYIWIDGSEIKITCRNREVKTPMRPGVVHRFPSLKDAEPIKISKEVAGKASFLSDIAYNDASKAELCCVFLTTAGEAMACSQKVAAVFKVPPVPSNFALSLLLSKSLKLGDLLYIFKKEMVLRSGTSIYSVPCPVKAQNEFPLKTVRQFGKAESTAVATYDGIKLAAAISETLSCMGQVARTEVQAHVNISKEKLEIVARNSTAGYRTSIKPLAFEQEETLRVPLDALSAVTPFMEGKVQIAKGKSGEFILQLESGWALFPSWSEPKKK